MPVPGARAPDGAGGNAPLRLVCTMAALEASLYAAVTPLLPHYVRELGLSDREVGVLVASYTVGIASGSLLGAWLAGRYGVRATCQWALVLLAVMCAVFGFGHHLVVLDVSRFLSGVGSGGVWAAGLTWVIRATPEDQRGAALGTAFGAAIVGTLVGPVIGTVALALGTAVPFGALSALALALAVVVARHPAPPALTPETPLPAWRAMLDGGIRTGAWLVLLGGFGSGAINVVVPLRIDGLGGPAWQVALVFLLSSAVAAVSAPLMGRAADRRGPRRPAFIALCISIPCLAFAAVPASIVVLGVLTVIGTGGGLTTLATAGSTLLSQRGGRIGINLAAVSATINICFALSETGGSLVSAFVIDATSDAVPLWLLAAAGLVTLVAIRPSAHATPVDRTDGAAVVRGDSSS